MKLLFLGCSWTYGCELAVGRRAKQTIIDKRYSTIIGKKLNAEVINLAENGISNHGIARIFLEQNLEEYDIIFVQMTLPNRTEWYDDTGIADKVRIMNKLKEGRAINKDQINVAKTRLKWNMKQWTKVLFDEDKFMMSGNLLDGIEWWKHYYYEIYTDTYGHTEEMLIYSLIKNKLVRMNKKHVISSINPKCKLPIDINLKKGKYPKAKGNHPNALGHMLIASNIMRLL